MQSQVRFNRICGHLIHGNRAVVFSALGFARFRKICKNKTLRLLGIPPKLVQFFLTIETNVCVLVGSCGQNNLNMRI